MTLTLTVMADAESEPAGYDSAIIAVPERWYITAGSDRGPLAGSLMLLVQLARRELRDVSEIAAANMGEKLHHAEWAITSDPAEVTTAGLMHDCAACLAGVDRAQAFLRDNPGRSVAVGQLWWAAP